MKTQLAVVALMLSTLSFAQMRKERGAVFPLDRELRNGGLMIAPGVTYFLGINESSSSENDGNTSIVRESSPSGKFGGSLQIGWFHSFEKNRIIDFLDFGVSYKLLRGQLTTKFTETNLNNNQVYEGESVLDFNDSHIGLFFNATKTIPLKQNIFMSHSLGLNVDHRAIEGGEYSGDDRIYFVDYPPIDIAQLHYKIGLGVRSFKNLLLIPSLETPILTFYPSDDLSPSLAYSKSNFQPILFSLQILFLRDDPVNCNNPVYNGPKYEVD